MTATIQINERHQNWPPIQLCERHQKAHSLIKFSSYQILVTYRISNYQLPLQSKFFFKQQLPKIVRVSKLQQLR